MSSVLISWAGVFPRLSKAQGGAGAGPVIDFHQHTRFGGRTNAGLRAHQRAMGVSLTVLLPAGALYGLGAGCGGNDSVRDLAGRHPEEFVFFANEIPTRQGAIKEMSKYLRLGGCGIGEQKFEVACDSPAMERVAELARDFRVPILMHFEHDRYNHGLERFHRMLEKFPDVNFVGHADAWWGHIGDGYDPRIRLPAGRVRPGGIADRLLTDYPNMYGDFSTRAGLNALIRDPEHASEFLVRHQEQLVFGSDCNDTLGRGPSCVGARILSAIHRLAPSGQVARRIVYSNAARLLKLKGELC